MASVASRRRDSERAGTITWGHGPCTAPDAAARGTCVPARHTCPTAAPQAPSCLIGLTVCSSSTRSTIPAPHSATATPLPDLRWLLPPPKAQVA